MKQQCHVAAIVHPAPAPAAARDLICAIVQVMVWERDTGVRRIKQFSDILSAKKINKSRVKNWFFLLNSRFRGCIGRSGKAPA